MSAGPLHQLDPPQTRFRPAIRELSTETTASTGRLEFSAFDVDRADLVFARARVKPDKAYRREPCCEKVHRRGTRRLVAGHAASSYSWIRPPRRSWRLTASGVALASGARCWLACRRAQGERAVRPVPVVVVGVDAEHVVEVAAVEDQQPVEALAADAADPALGVGVRVRRPHRRADDRDAFAAEDVVEAAAELAVAIVDQEAERLLASSSGISRLRACWATQAPSGWSCRRRTRPGGARAR